MAILPIRMFPDPVLREPAATVHEVDDSVRTLIRDLQDTMREAPGIGLAAPQVGVQRRVLVYDVGEGLNVLINPVIVEQQGTDEDEEGCLSIPGLAFPVVRACEIVVEGIDGDGERVRYGAEDLHARVIQHEVDHLNGILYLDRLSRSDRRAAMKELRERVLASSGPAFPDLSQV